MAHTWLHVPCPNPLSRAPSRLAVWFFYFSLIYFILLSNFIYSSVWAGRTCREKLNTDLFAFFPHLLMYSVLGAASCPFQKDFNASRLCQTAGGRMGTSAPGFKHQTISCLALPFSLFFFFRFLVRCRTSLTLTDCVFPTSWLCFVVVGWAMCGGGGITLPMPIHICQTPPNCQAHKHAWFQTD